MLSDEFVHFGKNHSKIETSSDYTENDEALPFIISSIRGDVWLLHVVTELVFSDESHTRYWRRDGQEARFDPSAEARQWMNTFLSYG
jgi:hypothetical protein